MLLFQINFPFLSLLFVFNFSFPSQVASRPIATPNKRSLLALNAGREKRVPLANMQRGHVLFSSFLLRSSSPFVSYSLKICARHVHTHTHTQHTCIIRNTRTHAQHTQPAVAGCLPLRQFVPGFRFFAFSPALPRSPTFFSPRFVFSICHFDF